MRAPHEKKNTVRMEKYSGEVIDQTEERTREIERARRKFFGGAVYDLESTPKDRARAARFVYDNLTDEEKRKFD